MKPSDWILERRINLCKKKKIGHDPCGMKEDIQAVMDYLDAREPNVPMIEKP